MDNSKYSINVKIKGNEIFSPIIFFNDVDAHKFYGSLLNDKFQINKLFEDFEKKIRILTKDNVDTNRTVEYNVQFYDGVSCEFLNGYLSKLDLKIDC